MQIQTADIVQSMAGHDKGKLMFVISRDGDNCLVASGKTGRGVERPKQKNIRHLQFIARTDCETALRLINGLTVQNCELRRDLAIYCENQGGIKAWQKTM